MEVVGGSIPLAPTISTSHARHHTARRQPEEYSISPSPSPRSRPASARAWRKAALAGRVDGKLVDTSFVIDRRRAALASSRTRIRRGSRSSAIRPRTCWRRRCKQLFPEAQVTIGPVIEDGFYYDFAFKRPFTPEDLGGHRSADDGTGRRPTCRSSAA